MQERLVLLKSFSTEIEALIVKGRLEAEDIDVHIRDQNIVTMNWLYSNAVGGVKLFVPASQLGAAKELLAEPIDTTSDQGEAQVWGQCPKCGSTDLAYYADKKLAWLSWLLAGFPLFTSQKRLHCKACNHWWKYEPQVQE